MIGECDDNIHMQTPQRQSNDVYPLSIDRYEARADGPCIVVGARQAGGDRAIGSGIFMK